MPLAIAIHGGAGLIVRDSLSPDREQACRDCLQRSTDAGWQVLERGGSAIDAVQAAVRVLEHDPVFNAGRGAVLAHGGHVELDACLMEGTTRRAGAITGATTPTHPIDAARAVLDDGRHVMLCGAGADRFIASSGVATSPAEYFITPERQTQYATAAETDDYGLDHGSDKTDVYGTVGAVACDAQGHIAAANSTGGMVNKRPGRVGDTPIVGAGTYAWDQTAAVAATGHGEPFIRLAVASRVSALMEMAGLSLHDATERVIHTDLPILEGKGGLVAVDRHGNVSMPFNTGGMFRAFRTGDATQIDIW